MEGDSVEMLMRPKVEDAPRRRPKKIKIPRRVVSVIEDPKVIVMTAGLKPKPVRLNRCLVSPLTLYELSAAVVDGLKYPDPFKWTEFKVAQWLDGDIGFPEYRDCILDNHINGRRLLRLEDPSQLPKINIHNFEHIKIITAAIRKLFATNYVRFNRSVSLPLRKPDTHCVWFKSLTGPVWGVRENYTRSDVLRWMKILNPKPIYLDHWDLVWYQKPDFPKSLLARIPERDRDPSQRLPKYDPPEDYCNEYLTPRKFRILKNVPEEAQQIWMEHRPGSPSRREPKKKDEEGMVKKRKEEKKPKAKKKDSRLLPQSIVLEGLSGKELILARRKRPKPKFLA